MPEILEDAFGSYGFTRNLCSFDDEGDLWRGAIHHSFMFPRIKIDKLAIGRCHAEMNLQCSSVGAATLKVGRWFVIRETFAFCMQE